MKFTHIVVLLIALIAINSSLSKRGRRSMNSSRTNTRSRTASLLRNQYRSLQKDIKIQENINKKYDEISKASNEVKKTIDQIVKAKKAVKGVSKEVADKIIANAQKVEETMKNKSLDKKSKETIVAEMNENSKNLINQEKKDNAKKTVNHTDKNKKDATAKDAATKTVAAKKVVNAVVPAIVKKVDKLSKELANAKKPEKKIAAEAKLTTQIGLLKAVATTGGAKNMSEATLPKIEKNAEKIKKLAAAGKAAEVEKLKNENTFLVDLAKKHTPLTDDEKTKVQRMQKLVTEIENNKNVSDGDKEKLTLKHIFTPKIKENNKKIKDLAASKLPEEQRNYEVENLKTQNAFLKEAIKKHPGTLDKVFKKINKITDDALKREVENMSREEFRKWILEKYDYISHELGVETRAISSVQNLLKLRREGAGQAGPSEEEAFLLNNFQNKVQADVQLVVAQAKEVVARRKIDTRRNINPLINNQDELHHLATVALREGKHQTRDFRARAIKILRNYHLELNKMPKDVWSQK